MKVNFTKIVATIGPASDSEAILRRFIDEGLDVVRLNFSHGTHESHQAVIDRVRRICAEKGAHVAILGDLSGPKIRVGRISPEPVALEVGAEFKIVRDDIIGDAEQFCTTYGPLVEEVRIGDRILFDDGQILARAIEKEPGLIRCACESYGELSSGKGVILPDTPLSMPAVTEKDKLDLEWTLDRDLDYVAVSFVRTAADVGWVKNRIRERGRDAQVVSKIETPDAVRNLEEIIRVSDAVLVARGDLGVTTDMTRVPILQKEIIRACYHAARPVIVATQMLQSMVRSPVPTRAEVSDVANATLDGADAVMLSAETAAGEYPIEALTTMRRIMEQIESYEREAPLPRRSRGMMAEFVGRKQDAVLSAVARSAVVVAHDLGVRWIAVWGQTGATCTWISKYRPIPPIIGLSADPRICRKLALCHGVRPFLVAGPIQAVDVGRGVEPTLGVRRLLLSVMRGLPDLAGEGGRETLILLVGNPLGAKREPVISIHAFDPAETTFP